MQGLVQIVWFGVTVQYIFGTERKSKITFLFIKERHFMLVFIGLALTRNGLGEVGVFSRRWFLLTTTTFPILNQVFFCAKTYQNGNH